ncbi:MAG: hypothetical protein K0Q52_181 [Microbacterium sp.]|jgi:hypothetical protein|nr:hypothetical protein [Microbacterium sp.]
MANDRTRNDAAKARTVARRCARHAKMHAAAALTPSGRIRRDALAYIPELETPARAPMPAAVL